MKCRWHFRWGPDGVLLDGRTVRKYAIGFGGRKIVGVGVLYPWFDTRFRSPTFREWLFYITGREQFFLIRVLCFVFWYGAPLSELD